MTAIPDYSALITAWFTAGQAAFKGLVDAFAAQRQAGDARAQGRIGLGFGFQRAHARTDADPRAVGGDPVVARGHAVYPQRVGACGEGLDRRRGGAATRETKHARRAHDAAAAAVGAIVREIARRVLEPDIATPEFAAELTAFDEQVELVPDLLDNYLDLLMLAGPDGEVL